MIWIICLAYTSVFNEIPDFYYTEFHAHDVDFVTSLENISLFDVVKYG